MAYPVIESRSQTLQPSSGTVVVDKPSGVIEGDLLLAFRTAARASGVSLGFNTPDGWASSGEINPASPSGSALRSAWYWKIATASEPATYSFTLSVTHASQHVTIFRISGHDDATPIVLNYTPYASVSLTNFTTPTIDIAGSESLVFFGAVNVFNATPFAGSLSPAYTSEVAETIAGSFAHAVRLGWDNQTSPGDTTNRVWSFSSQSVSAATAWTVVVNSNQAVPPEAFDTADWAVADATTGSRLLLLIDALPTSAEPITDIEYRLDGGSAVSTGLTAPDIVVIAGLTNGQAYNVEVRAVSANGAGPWSSVKSATPTIGGGGGGIGGIARLLGNGLLG